ncbi:MAG: FUSC family protein, partial [Gemmatimonadales bacterium]|nr:FUSC family protein [Gemmatimonadales bacterium]
MTPLRRALHEVRAAAALEPARPAWAAGLRAAIATVVPLVVDALFGVGGGTWMSLAGFSNALADRGGPYRTRAVTMAVLTCAAAAAAALGTLGAVHAGLAAPLAFAVAVGCSLARVWGNAGAGVGGAALST